VFDAGFIGAGEVPGADNSMSIDTINVSTLQSGSRVQDKGGGVLHDALSACPGDAGLGVGGGTLGHDGGLLHDIRNTRHP
jgi:hypothetical protein